MQNIKRTCSQALRWWSVLLSLLVLSAANAADSTGSFVQPLGGSREGNLLISVRTEDLDGQKQVAVRFGTAGQLVLCDNVSQCQGRNFKVTRTNIDPAQYGSQPGPLALQLWVTDSLDNELQVASTTLNWQPVGRSSVTLSRSSDGTSLAVSWNAHPSVLRYSLYLASAPGVNRQTYRQLPDGQARLAVRGASASFSALDPAKTYYLQVTGIQGSGESAIAPEQSSQSPLQPNGQPLAADDEYISFRLQELVVAADQGLLKNDSDPDGDPLTVVVPAVVPPQSGALVLASDGSFSYTPLPGFSGNDSFIYRLSDGKGGTAEAVVHLEVEHYISSLRGDSLNMQGQFLYIGQGELTPGSQIGTGLYRIGDCIQLVDTRCVMQGRYAETADSGHEPAGQGDYFFMMTYPGTGNSPVLARSVSALSNNVQFIGTGGARFELNLFPDSGGRFVSVFPEVPFASSLNFSAFIGNSASCTGLPVGIPCSIGQVGRFSGAVMNAPLDRIAFTIPAAAVNNPGPFPPEPLNDEYIVTANSPLSVGAPGVLANDSDGKLVQGNSLEVRQQLSPGLGSLVALAADEYRQQLYLYPSFGSSVYKRSRLGVDLGTVDSQGEPANDADLDFTAQTIRLNNVTVPQGSLLMFNGETDQTEIFAIQPQNGTVLAQLQTDFGASHVVGGAYNPLSKTFWLLQDNVPAAAVANRVAEIDPATGEVLSTFGLITAEHSFDVSFGDLHINPHNGNLLLVSSVQNRIAEFSRSGVLLRTLALPAGVGSLSGLAVSADGSLLWLSNTAGTVYELGFANKGSWPTLRVELLDAPAHGTVLLKADGSFSYTPQTGYTGADSFSYRVFGAFGGSKDAVVLLDVQ